MLRKNLTKSCGVELKNFSAGVLEEHYYFGVYFLIKKIMCNQQKMCLDFLVSRKYF